LTRLYEEVKSAVDANGEINYEMLAKLPYLDAVISETLRLYPPARRLDRETTTVYKLADTGIELYKGQVVHIPVYALHHSEEYYPNAERFNPDRFLPENRHQITPYTYLPFGGGPRNCIGMRFALMEAKLGLAQIVQRYRFVRSPNTDVPLKMVPGRRLLQSYRVIVGIEKR
jgi:cytochrome P450